MCEEGLNICVKKVLSLCEGGLFVCVKKVFSMCVGGLNSTSFNHNGNERGSYYLCEGGSPHVCEGCVILALAS